MRIGIDVDGVLCDVLTSWLGRCNTELARQDKGRGIETSWEHDDIDRFDFWNQIGLSEAKVWELFTSDVYDEAPPYSGALEAVTAILELGHEIIYVTSCQNVHEYTAKCNWLARHNFCASTEWRTVPVGKWAYYQRKQDVPDLDWLVDDYVPNLKDFAGYAVLFTRPWNAREEFIGKRVKSLGEVVDMLKYLQPVPQADGDEGEVGQEERLPIMQPYPNEDKVDERKPTIRTFGTGATRDTDTGKHDPEGFLSPLVIDRFNAFMHKNRYQRDGSVRDSDNWQKGIPLTAYMKSGWRHFLSWWKAHRSGQPLTEQQIDELCALWFNVQGYLHETLKAKNGKTE